MFHTPATVGDYTDLYAGLHHAANVGRLFRPGNPLLPNDRWVPTAQGKMREMEANGNERDQAWVDAKCTPHPLQASLDRPSLTGARERVPRELYVPAAGYAGPTFDAAFERLQADTT